MRVYEIAKEVGIPNKDLLVKIRALGLEVNNHMSSLGEEDVARIKRSIEKERQGAGAPEPVSTARNTAAPVVRRRKADEVDGPSIAEGTRTIAPAPEVRHPTPHSTTASVPNPVTVAPPMVRRRPVEEPVVRVERPVEPTSQVRVMPQPVKVAVASEAARIEPVVATTVPETGSSTPNTNVVNVMQETPVVTAHEAAPAKVTELPVVAPSVSNSPTAVESAPVDAVTPANEAPLATGSGPVATHVAVEPARIRSRAIIAGPAVVTRGVPAPEPKPAPPAVVATPVRNAPAAYNPPPSTPLPPRSPAVVVRTRDSSPAIAPGPVVAQTARSRFEEELERARARTAVREDKPTRPNEVVVEVAAPAVAPRDPSRPAVGSVIALPPRIKITERAPVGGRPAAPPPGGPMGNVRGRFAQQQKGGPQNRGNTAGGGPGHSREPFGKKKLPLGKKGNQTRVTTPAEHKRVIRIEDTITIGDISHQMGVKATEVLKKLWGMGMVGVTINAAIDLDTAQLLASEFGYEVQNVAFKEEDIFSGATDEPDALHPRSPVVTVMGHVDHGKTSLLDAIRKARVAAGEAGGITQHIAAYKVAAPGHGDIVFLDTPGHEAFTEMRARGAQATDIVVLVVASNDGAMPQTLEALAHAKDAKVNIIVAVNKCDLPDAQPDRVRQQLADHGLIPEEWGGETMYVNVSALKGEGIAQLIETIALSAEMLELKANPNKMASGLVIEARLDRNRGPMATVLVQEGTLRVGDIVVAGRTVGKVRALLDDLGQPIKEAGPSTPVELLGLDGVPEAGDAVNVAEDDRAAKSVVEHRRQQWRKRELASTAKVSLEGLMERFQEGESKELKVVLKADVQGSSEALKAALVKLSTDKVKVNCIAAGVGGITESDVNLAKAGGAVIVGFHVRPAGKSSKLAEQEGVEIRLYDIIYDALDDVKKAMAGLLAPIRREVAMGKLEIREVFSIPKVGAIGGCMVTDGKVTRRAHLRVIRDAVQVYEGKVGSLRRFKDDVSEVQQGYECGLQVAGWNEMRPGDVVEAYDVVEEAAQL